MKTLSLFSGCGGLDVGAEMAGAEVVCCIDNDQESLDSIAMNDNGSKTLLNADISQLDGRTILEAADLSVGDIELIIGGPPCQSFSKNNYWTRSGEESLRRRKRMKKAAQVEGREFIDHVNLPRKKYTVGVDEDVRSNLVSEKARLIQELQPRAFVFENVQSITHPKNKKFLLAFKEAVESAGYKTSEFRLSSEMFGVAQKRKRVFVVGHKSESVEAPLVTHSEDPSLFLKPIVTSSEAISQFNEDQFFESEEVISGRWAKYFPDIPPGMNYKALTAWAGYPNPVFEAETRFWNFLLKLHPDKPSWTIASNPGPWIGPFHWENRRLRIPEMAAIQSFPSGYKLAGNRRSKVRQIGNAVPPLMAKAVVETLSR